MQKAYNRINWENYPSDATPLNETNLNRVDAAVDELDNRVITHETTKATKTEVATLVQDVTFEESTGIFTITKKNGAVLKIDTKLEKIAVNFTYDKTTQQIILTLIDGTKQYIDLSALITQFEFLDTATIGFEITADGRVKATVLDGSITEDKLQPNYLADIKVETAKAQNSATAAEKSAASAKTSETNAKTSETNAASAAGTASEKAGAAAVSETNASESAKRAESYAVGGTGTRAGEDTDNAKYYSQAAAASGSAASESAKRAESYAVGGTGTRAGEDTDNAKYYSQAAAASAAEIGAAETNAADSAAAAAASAAKADAYANGSTDSAKYYYEQAKGISESFSGALRPMGTVMFAALPDVSSAVAGEMYNISDQFTTTAGFKEGAGNTVPAGANVYRTADGYWDILAGTPVTGVKGAAEETYRIGNVNITAENIGIPSTKATATSAGFMSAEDKVKLNCASAGRYFTNEIQEGYYKININSQKGWMLCFTIRVYVGYRSIDIMVSGYNYDSNYWYAPQAVILGDSLRSHVAVTFGYDSLYNLWVAVPAGAYTGLKIVNVTNGFMEIDEDTDNLFSITHVAELTGTVQTSVIAWSPYYRDDIIPVANGGTGQVTIPRTLQSYFPNPITTGEGSIALLGGGWDNNGYISIGEFKEMVGINRLNSVMPGAGDLSNVTANAYLFDDPSLYNYLIYNYGNANFAGIIGDYNGGINLRTGTSAAGRHVYCFIEGVLTIDGYQVMTTAATGGDVHLPGKNYGVFWGTNADAPVISFFSNNGGQFIFAPQGWGTVETLKTAVYLGGAGDSWAFFPRSDFSGNCNLGVSGCLWNNVYAKNGTIQTSDRTKKTDIADLDGQAAAFIAGLKPSSYRLKNGESGRTHYGLIAQDVEELMQTLGMDSKDFAGFIKSPKTVQKDIYDEDGNLTGTEMEIVEGEYEYALRYEEFIAPLIKTVQIQQQEIDALRAELAELKESVAEIMN